jgi:predicted aldo/keto reductase-like oxidoreductase
MAKKEMKRRHFIRNSAAGLVTAGLGLTGLKAGAQASTSNGKIVYRTLGRTGMRIPIVSYGVMNSDSPDLLNRALDAGINHLDTAHVYLRGKSEQVIGDVIERRGDRDKIYVATKMRFNQDRTRGVFLEESSERAPGATEENFFKQLALSLERLKTDYVDILYLHSCSTPAMTTYEPLMNALMKAKKEGKARFIGTTTHNDEANVIRASVDAGIYDVVLTAYNFIQTHREEVKKAIAYAASKNVGIIAMKTQGGSRVQREGKIEIDHAAALKWVMNDPNVCTSIPGMTTFGQLDLNMKSMAETALTAAETNRLARDSSASDTLYCHGCRSCVSTCQNGVEIPDIMRAYMYAEGYKNPVQARETIAELPQNRGLDACRMCSTCRATCSNGLQIAPRLEYLIKHSFHLG